MESSSTDVDYNLKFLDLFNREGTILFYLSLLYLNTLYLNEEFGPAGVSQ